jgi:hypothetical protein
MSIIFYLAKFGMIIQKYKPHNDNLLILLEYQINGTLYLLGGLLVRISTLQAKAFPRWASWLVIAGVLATLCAAALSSWLGQVPLSSVLGLSHLWPIQNLFSEIVYAHYSPNTPG